MTRVRERFYFITPSTVLLTSYSVCPLPSFSTQSPLFPGEYPSLVLSSSLHPSSSLIIVSFPSRPSSLFLDVKSISTVKVRGKGGRKVLLYPLPSVGAISAKDLSPLVYYCLLALFYHPWSFCLYSKRTKSPPPSPQSVSFSFSEPPFFLLDEKKTGCNFPPAYVKCLCTKQ